jgi:hypothetical protein
MDLASAFTIVSLGALASATDAERRLVTYQSLASLAGELHLPAHARLCAGLAISLRKIDALQLDLRQLLEGHQ